MTHPATVSRARSGSCSARWSRSSCTWSARRPRDARTCSSASPQCRSCSRSGASGTLSTAALRAFGMGVRARSSSPSPLTLLAVHAAGLRTAVGPGLALMSFMFAWFADTGGYFGGRFFGKHKLYEVVSPKKTVEGAIGGLGGERHRGAHGELLGYLREIPLSTRDPARPLRRSARGRRRPRRVAHQALDRGERLRRHRPRPRRNPRPRRRAHLHEHRRLRLRARLPRPRVVTTQLVIEECGGEASRVPSHAPLCAHPAGHSNLCQGSS